MGRLSFQPPMPQAIFPATPRPGDVYAGRLCASCGDTTGKRTRPFSRYCGSCFSRVNRTRHPDGKLPKRADLAPWKNLAHTALTRWRLDTDPAVQKAYSVLSDLVNTPDVDVTQEKFRRELYRMRCGGPEPDVMLSRCMGVVGLYFLGFPDRAMKADATYWAALGYAWLRSVPYPEPARHWQTGRRRARKEAAGTTAEAFGYLIACKLETFMRSLWERVLAEQQQRATNYRQALHVIETTPSIRVDFPSDGQRRQLAKSVAKQRRAEEAAVKAAAQAKALEEGNAQRRAAQDAVRVREAEEERFSQQWGSLLAERSITEHNP